MSSLWVLPVAVIALGMAVLAAVARHTAIAADELRRSCSGLAELGDAVAGLRVDAQAVRSSVDGLRDSRAIRQTADR
jgi:hypothetical protein